MRILLLGGASELGVAICVELLRSHRAEVVAAGRPASPHRGAAIEQLRAAGAISVDWLDFDASEVGTHPEVIGRAFERPVDVAIVAFGLLDDRDTWRDQLATVRLAQTNYTGALSVGVLLAQQLSRQGSGQIIALSSVAGERVRRANFVYGSSKAGMDGFYRQLGVALAGSGVTVLVVRPGAVTGRMTAGRARVLLSSTPEQVARATVRARQAGKTLIRVPAIFALVMAVYRNLPAGLVDRFSSLGRRPAQ